jgi:hypothetical protein
VGSCGRHWLRVRSARILPGSNCHGNLEPPEYGVFALFQMSGRGHRICLMTIYAYRRSAPLFGASVAAAALLVVAADQIHTPGLRNVAPSPEDASQDNIRAAVARHRVNATDPDQAGIWKAATPARGTMHGEFENNDPIGLSAGVRIKADCSINWVDPDSGKRYCFSSATSLIVFLDAPRSYLARAAKNWVGTNTVSNP